METGVAVVERAARVDHVARRLLGAESNIAVVTDGSDRVLGVVTPRDIVPVCAERLSAATTSVSQIMEREFVTCDVGDEVSAVVDLTIRKGVRYVVVTEGREFAGVIELSRLVAFAQPAQLDDLRKNASSLNRPRGLFEPL